MNQLIFKVWVGEFTIFAGLKTREAGGYYVRNESGVVASNTFYEVST